MATILVIVGLIFRPRHQANLPESLPRENLQAAPTGGTADLVITYS
jgi:hypothetical protein